MAPTGFEPATYGLEVRRSIQAELRGHRLMKNGGFLRVLFKESFKYAFYEW